MLPYLPCYADVLHTINRPELLNIPSRFITKQKKNQDPSMPKHQSAIFSGSVTTSSAKTCLVRSQIGGEEELAESVDGVEVGTTGLVEMEVQPWLGVDSGVLTALGSEEDQLKLASAPRPKVMSARLVKWSTLEELVV
ncbi:hypothetical protein FF2_037790 [Malus domestica]